MFGDFVGGGRQTGNRGRTGAGVGLISVNMQISLEDAFEGQTQIRVQTAVTCITAEGRAQQGSLPRPAIPAKGGAKSGLNRAFSQSSAPAPHVMGPEE